MALPAGYSLVEPEKTKLPAGYTLVTGGGGLPSIAKSQPREAPTYDPLGQVVGDISAPMDYEVEGKGKMNEPGAFTTLADLAKQFIAPGLKAPFALPLATETAVKGFARQAMEGNPEALMPSSVYQPGLDTEETLFGPETEEQKARRKLQAQRAVAAMPSIPGAKALNKIGENVQKDIQNSLSDEAKKALKESQLTGNIFKGEVDFGTNPTAYGYALQASNVFGSMAPVIATAMVTKSPGVGGFVGGTMAADEAATNAAEYINKMPDAELLKKSPFYAQMISGGASPKEARELTIKKAAESGAALQGLVATFGDVLTGKLVTGAFDKAIAKLGTNRLARGVGVGAASGLEESLQETGEGVASDVAIKNVVPSKELGEDSAGNFLLGFIGGAGPGVVKGALTKGEAREPEREKYVKPEGGLAELIARQKGFLTPEGAPRRQAPAAEPMVSAEPITTPPSASQDTEAMLREILGEAPKPQLEEPSEQPPSTQLTKEVLPDTNTVSVAKKKAPVVEAPAAEEPAAKEPATVKVYRGHQIGEEFKSADDGNLGAGYYTTESEQAAKEFASRNENGTVLQGELKANRILDMDNLTKEDIANLKRAIPTTAEELQAYGIPYYDEATNELVTEDLQKIHSNLNRGGFEPRKLSDALPQGYTDALGAIYKEAGYDAITRMGDALKSGTKYKEYVTFSPESQKLLTPAAEPTLKEQYDKAAKLNFMAPDAFRNKRITQEQYDQIKSDYERIKAQYQASIPKTELSPVQQEATDIADKLEALGQTPFANGMRTAIEKNQVSEKNMEFYRNKLKQEQAKQNTLEEGVERPSEKWSWSTFYGDDTKGLEKLNLFNSKASPEAKQALQSISDSIQAVTDRLNDEGYAMRGTPDSTTPKEIRDLRSQIQMRSAEGSLLINKFEALNKGFNRSKKTSNQENLDQAIKDAKAGAAEAQKSLQRSIPEPEEVVNARAEMAEANKRIENLQYKSGSLWAALRGKLDPEEVREIFGRNPNLGQKKLQVTKKSGQRGTYISEMADDGLLDQFLPIDMRRESSRFDAVEASQYIKDLVANQDYLPFDVKKEIEDIEKAYGPVGDLIDEYLTIKEQNRELQIAADEQREADQAAEIIEPEGENRPVERGKGQEREFELTAPTADEIRAKQDEIDRLTKENERLAKAAEAKAKADEQAQDFVLTGSNREADQAAARGQKDIFGETIEEAPAKPKAKEPPLSLEYTKALDESREATKEFSKAQEAYRAQKIDDDEFLIARKKYDLAIAQFDQAFKKEQNRPTKKAEPEVAEEVLPAEEPQIAGQLENEPYTFEGQFTEIGDEEQRTLITDQSSKLSDAQINTLEKEYGAKNGSDEFFEALRKDVIAYVTQGAKAVSGKIRAIIRQVANGLLSVAIVFNPQFVSQPYTIAVPQYDIRTSEVVKDLPKEAQSMSDAAKRAYGVIYPTLEAELKEKNKLFIVADKQSANTYIFQPDGSLLLQSKTLFGAGIGDFMKGDNNIVANRITPAGLFDLGMRDAKRSASEEYMYGDYDFGKVFVLDKSYMGRNGPYSQLVMHSVWTNEKDAKQRLAALDKPGAEDSRYSFGCINVNKETFRNLITNHLDQMDGAKIFIVPENGSNVMDFVNGKATYSEDIIRQRVTPVTKTTKIEKQRAAPKTEERTLVAKEEEPGQYMSLESPNIIQIDGRSIPVTKHRLEKENKIVNVNTDAFDNAFANTKWQYIGEGGEGGIGDRYKTFGNFIKTAKSIDAPNVSVNKDGAIVFGDGRHRYAYLRDAGLKNIPLSMDAESIRNAQKFGYISEPINMSLGDSLVKLVDQMADGLAEDKKKRSPSFKRQAKTLTNQRNQGKLTEEEFLERMNAAIAEDEDRRLAADIVPRKRGYLLIQERMSEAVRNGDLSREAYDLANWFMLQNEALVDDLGISIKGKGPLGAGGFYNNLSQIITLIKEGSSDLTATHEILHHLERMMPTKIQQAIRKAWLSQLIKAQKTAKSPASKLYFAALMDAHFGSNDPTLLNIPEGAGNEYAAARSNMEDSGKKTSMELAKQLLLLEFVPIEAYQYFDPSEFWAVNGSDIVKARYDAVKGGVLAKLKNWLSEFGQKVKSVFGLNSDASIIRALDSLAKSDGKFVTDNMLVQGEYQNLQRRNYQGGEAPEADMEIPEMSFMDNMIHSFGDKHIDTKRLIESINKAGKKLHEQFDAYMKEENYHGRLAKRVEDFLDDEMRPVLQEMQDKGVTLDEVEKFLHNRHAKEANAYIASVNPKLPDGGSGITDEAADQYMANLSPEQRSKLESVAKKIDGIIKQTQRTLVQNGLETQETIDEWNKTYKHYIPLMRDQLDFVYSGRGVMGGFATRGSASKRRVGSEKPVKDIFANIAMQRERALRRSEQARVGRALYGMAIKHPNPGFWLAINPDAIKDKDKLEAELISLGLSPEDAKNIIQEPKQPFFDPKTGMVRYQVNPLLRNSPNVFPVRINGQDRFIFFNPNDPRSLRMVESMKNLDTEKLGAAIGAVGAVTRWIASVNTQYNIVFGGVNFLRDLGAASLNLSTTELAGKEKEVRANVLPALRAIYRQLRSKEATTEDMQEMQNMFERYQLAGGQTGYQNQFAETERKANIVEREIKHLNRGNIKKTVDSVFNWLSDYNDAIENAVRLSAFKVAVESGLSEDKAASIAKNLTVNFNRKGAKSGLISTLYAFFNAAVQGSARMIQTLRGPMGKKIIYGGMFLGSIQAIALMLSGFDDDEPPEFVKDKNFIFPIPFTNKKYIAIPMPLGFNIFPGLGRLATETMLIQAGMLKSNKGVADKMGSAISLVFDAFNPFGGSGNVLQMVAPTILDPFAALYSNRDAFGRPIYKEDRGTAPTPGFERSRENASIFSQKLAEALNWATSPAGTKHTKGAISPTADQIDYFIGQITGGVGREIMKAGEFVKSKAITQEEVPAYRIPVLGRFYGEADSPAATRSRFYDNVKEMAKHEHEIKGLRKDKTSPTEYIKENPEAKLWQRANNVENQITRLNKEKKVLIEKGASREAIKHKEDEIIKKMKSFNDQVSKVQ
jgi:Large polyvalent protein associated domain 38